MDRSQLFSNVYQNFGGEEMSQGQQIGFNQVTDDLGYSPVQIALELSKQNSAEAINSSLFGDSQGGSEQATGVTPTSLNGYPITQTFGNKSNIEVFSGGVNTGVDIGVPEKTPIALPSGRWQVEEVYDKASNNGYIGNSENRGYGNSLVVRNLDTGERLRFSHLSSVYTPSDTLSGGQIIGFSGRSGNATGPHIDVEYKNSQGQLEDFLKTNYAKELGL